MCRRLEVTLQVSSQPPQAADSFCVAAGFFAAGEKARSHAKNTCEARKILSFGDKLLPHLVHQPTSHMQPSLRRIIGDRAAIGQDQAPALGFGQGGHDLVR